MTLSVISILVAWIIGIISIVTNPRSKQNLWLAVIMLISSTMGIGSIMMNLSKDFDGAAAGSIENIGAVIMQLAYFVYYPYLNFTFYSSGFFKDNKFIIRYFPIITLIPTLYIALTRPFSLDYTPSAIPMMIWKNSYVLFSIILLTMALLKNRRNGEAESHLKNFILFVPTVILLFIVNDLSYLTGHAEMYQYNVYIILYVIAVLVIFTVKDGYLGIHIKLERTEMKGSVETLNLATAFLTHDFKNEFVKVSEFIDRIKDGYPGGINDTDAEKWFKMIDVSRSKIREIFRKMKLNITDGIALEFSRYNVKDIIDEALRISSYYEANPDIVKLDVDANILAECDYYNTARVFANLIDNAYEAISEKPLIRIYAYESGKYVCTVIEDNGRGIPEENIKKVIRPFYSTKPAKVNLGLGLAYCYDIISMSKGKLVITSKEKKGTRIYVYLKINRKR